MKADQRARGRYLGGIVPFGWQVGGTGDLVAGTDQQAATCQLRELHRAGTSPRRIAAEMEKVGHSVSNKGVKKILSAPAPGYVGG